MCYRRMKDAYIKTKLNDKIDYKYAENLRIGQEKGRTPSPIIFSQSQWILFPPKAVEAAFY